MKLDIRLMRGQATDMSAYKSPLLWIYKQMRERESHALEWPEYNVGVMLGAATRRINQ